MFKLGLLGIVYCISSNEDKAKALFQLQKIRDKFPSEVPDLSQNLIGGLEMTGKEGKLIKKIETLFLQLVETSSVLLMKVNN